MPKTKNNKQEFIKWVKKQIDYYKPYLDINLQEIEVKYKKEIEYLEISFGYPYLEPIINFSDEAVENWTEGKLKKDRILHELCHIITDPLYAKAVSRYVSANEIENERERLTDTITIILNNLIK